MLTLCLGIIAGLDPDGIGYGLVGVAPEASLYAYRVLGCVGGTHDDILMQAFQKAGEDGVDVISLSVGGARVWETSLPLQPIFTALTQKGIGLVIANGNDGYYGPYLGSSPALIQEAIAVGSVSNTKFPTMFNSVDSKGRTVEYARNTPINKDVGYSVLVMDVCDGFLFDEIPTYDDPNHVIALLPWNNGGCVGPLAYPASLYGVVNVW